MIKLKPEFNQYAVNWWTCGHLVTKSNHQEDDEKNPDKEKDKEPNLYGVNY